MVEEELFSVLPASLEEALHDADESRPEVLVTFAAVATTTGSGEVPGIPGAASCDWLEMIDLCAGSAAILANTPVTRYYL